MADRRRTHTTLPCRNPDHECGGMAVCRTSRLIMFHGHLAREHDRICERCERHTKTIEFESRCLYVGNKSENRNRDFVPHRRLF